MWPENGFIFFIFFSIFCLLRDLIDLKLQNRTTLVTKKKKKKTGVFRTPIQQSQFSPLLNTNQEKLVNRINQRE